jgi:RNA-binding protein
MAFDHEKIKQLRTIGHKLNPIVTISENGLSDGVANELQRALDDHELIKIKLAITDRDARQAALDDVIRLTQAELVQKIGKVALICRIARKTNKRLSNLHRIV